jgi:hypothetical protein
VVTPGDEAAGPPRAASAADELLAGKPAVAAGVAMAADVGDPVAEGAGVPVEPLIALCPWDDPSASAIAMPVAPTAATSKAAVAASHFSLVMDRDLIVKGIY